MTTKSRQSIYGASVRAAAERAKEARKEADRLLACDAWNKRMLGYRGPAPPSPALGDALNAGLRSIRDLRYAASAPIFQVIIRLFCLPTRGWRRACS